MPHHPQPQTTAARRTDEREQRWDRRQPNPNQNPQPQSQQIKAQINLNPNQNPISDTIHDPAATHNLNPNHLNQPIEATTHNFNTTHQSHLTHHPQPQPKSKPNHKPKTHQINQNRNSESATLRTANRQLWDRTERKEQTKGEKKTSEWDFIDQWW